MHGLEALPPEIRDVAHAALNAAFGATPIVSQRRVVGGASGAQTFRVEAGGRAYLLRVAARRSGFRNPHQYVCLQTAAEAGIAPQLRYVDPAAGVVVMDFVQHRPLEEYPGGPTRLASDVGALVRRLQGTAAFPTLGAYPDMLARLLAFIDGSRLFAEGALGPYIESFERIRSAYRWRPSELVSSHNDPNPANILFDGERLWLIDWETSYRNDPLTDVAILTENLSTTPELEDVLLAAWLGSTPGRLLRARLLLMRQLTRLYYAALIFSLFCAERRGAKDADLGAPSPAEFAQLTPGLPETSYLYGKVCLAAFASGAATPDFERALKVASSEDF